MLKYIRLLPLLSVVAFGQSVNLNLTSGSGTAGSTVSLALQMNNSGSGASALEWTVNAPIPDVQSITASAGPAAAAASKSIQCVVNRCVLYGLNANVIPNGTVAILSVQLAPSASGNLVVQLSNASASSTAGASLGVTATNGIVSVIAPPQLSVTSTHAGSFVAGQLNASYAVSVSNGTGAAPTSGTVTVTDTIPSGLTLISMGGTGWSCSANSCTRGDVLAGGAAYPPITVAVNVAGNASSPQVNLVSVSGGGSPTAHASDSTIVLAAPTLSISTLSISKTHSGNFTQGQTAATYTLIVSNGVGAAPTAGTVMVAESAPPDLTVTSMAGLGWNCSTSTCNRSDALPGGSSYPAILVTVNVAANAASSLSNQVSVSGGGSFTAYASDPTTIASAGQASLRIINSHAGEFVQGQQGATYILVVSNNAGVPTTSGTVTVADTVPSGLALISMAGTGWSCTANSCTRGDALAGGASYPSITVTVNVSATAASPQVNQSSVSGGGSVSATSSDSTIIAGFFQANLSVNRKLLNFGSSGSLITNPQTVLVTLAGGANVPWTATPDRPGIIVNPTSGVGTGTFQVSAAPGSSAVITVAAAGATPQSIQVGLASVTPTVPIGSFDTPVDGTTGVMGAIPITGWALDNIEVSRVDIFREAIVGEPGGSLVFIGSTVFSSDARPDVAVKFPTYPYQYRAGWGYQLLTNSLPNASGSGAPGNGTYTLHAIAFNAAGFEVDLGTKTITVDNAHATKPFGSIDTPGQGGTISGDDSVNFGWALTPQPGVIPFDGSTISVVIDGVVVGHPTYNQSRSDIASLFPGLANSGGAVGFFHINTTTLANGNHTISWNVFDNLGRGEGLGSRYFNVLNTGTVATASVREDVMTEIPMRKTVEVRHGLNVARRLDTPETDAAGRYLVTMEELGRIELHLGAISGRMLVGGESQALPTGSTLRGGIFYWQPGPGFLGQYEMEFERADGSRITVRANVQPKRFPVD
jgi:uncharacterized repeat protein (TIGR01451 family)